MQFDKTQILDLLKSQGQHDQATQAEGQLPDTVDTDRDSGLLQGLGLDPMKLIGMLTAGGAGGAGGLGGLAGGLGGMLGR